MKITLGGKIHPVTADVVLLTVHISKEDKSGKWTVTTYGDGGKRLYPGDVQPTEVGGKFVFNIDIGKTRVVATVDADGTSGTLFYDHGEKNRTITVPLSKLPTYRTRRAVDYPQAPW